jgi:acyl-CoA thioester hydrolase
MRTAAYAGYFIDHRMDAIREQAGWSAEMVDTLPFMVYTRRMEIDFVRPVVADQVVEISSSVRDFEGADANIECVMEDQAGATLARCRIVVTYVDRATGRPADWPAAAVEPFIDRDET